MDSREYPVLILGTGPFAIEVLDLISEVPGLCAAGFVENMDRNKCAEKLAGLDVLWVEEIAGLAKTHLALCGLGTTHRSIFTGHAAKLGFDFATLVHPTAAVSKGAVIGAGSIVGRGSIVSTHTRIGRHVLINRGVLIGHHTEIGSHVTISPGANVAGSCVVKDAAYIGMGAVIIDHVTVGSRSVVGAGAVVTGDVPDRVLVVGVPAKVVKENISGK